MENQKFGNIDRDNREVQNNDVRRNERNKYESNLIKEDQNVNSDYSENKDGYKPRNNSNSNSSSNKDIETVIDSDNPELYSPDGNKEDNPENHKDEYTADMGDEFIEKDQKKER
jgi:hypothetical protein